MAVKKREYMLSVNNLSKPKVNEGPEAIAFLLIRLLLLNPGSNPLHPDMGVGLEEYRFCIGKLDELEERIKAQIKMFLPEFLYSEVRIVQVTEEKICNLEITIDDITYVYDSSVMPIQLTLEEFAG